MTTTHEPTLYRTRRSKDQPALAWLSPVERILWRLVGVTPWAPVLTFLSVMSLAIGFSGASVATWRQHFDIELLILLGWALFSVFAIKRMKRKQVEAFAATVAIMSLKYRLGAVTRLYRRFRELETVRDGTIVRLHGRVVPKTLVASLLSGHSAVAGTLRLRRERLCLGAKEFAIDYGESFELVGDDNQHVRVDVRHASPLVSPMESSTTTDLLEVSGLPSEIPVCGFSQPMDPCFSEPFPPLDPTSACLVWCLV